MKLNPGNNTSQSDYINASFVEVRFYTYNIIIFQKRETFFHTYNIRTYFQSIIMATAELHVKLPYIHLN